MTADIVVIGAGMGGAALASCFVGSGLRVLLLERGGYLPTEAANWDPVEVIRRRRYDPGEWWEDESGRDFRPRVYYNVGGSSKFFGGTAFRFRPEDFSGKSYPEGSTVPWPVTYDEMSPWYDRAEEAMKVHGLAGADLTEAPRGPYPHSPVESEEVIAHLAEGLRAQGLHPFPLPVAVDQGPLGRCRKGSPCDGFPCRIRAKGDGENAFLRPALQTDENITVQTEMLVEELVVNASGTAVVEARGRGPAGSFSVRGKVFVLCAGAVNTAVLLLRSRSRHHPDGLANGSGVVGRHLMAHNNTVMMAFETFRLNPTRFQKTLAVNDFYHQGNIQMRGKILPENLAAHPSRWVRILRRFIARRSVDFWVMSEDLPDPQNRVEMTPSGRIRFIRRPTNMAVHENLVARWEGVLRRAGFPFIVLRKPRTEAVQHQCGTVRFGVDPAVSALDPSCRSHEVDNLYVADASVFPSSAAVNPALTVAANAMRVGALIRERLSG